MPRPIQFPSLHLPRYPSSHTVNAATFLVSERVKSKYKQFGTAENPSIHSAESGSDAPDLMIYANEGTAHWRS